MANLFTYLMLVLNLAVVCVIVYKTVTFPCRSTAEPALRRMLQEIVDETQVGSDETASCSCSQTRYLQQISATDMARYEAQMEGAPDTTLEKYLRLALIVIPVVTGILLTFNNAFSPTHKYNALRVSSQAIQWPSRQLLVM